MSRLVSFVLWFATAMGVLFGIHWYLWTRLVRDVGLPAPWRGIATAALVFAGLLIPASMILGRALRGASSTPVVWAGYIWMGLMFLLLVVVGTGDLLRLIGLGVANLLSEGGVDAARRQFLARALAAGGTASAASLGLFAVIGARTPRVAPVRVDLRRFPAALDGFRIAQISDLHVGPTIGRDDVEAVVRVNAEKPDLIAITGDLIDGSVDELAEAVEPLRHLEARFGTFFVTGNHEYYSGAIEWLRHLPTLGIRPLRNERLSIGEGADSFDLAGVDDETAGQFPGHGVDVARAVAGRDPHRELVLLAHQPKTVRAASEHGVGLQLSGHTHGGQIWPFGYLVALAQPYVAGLFQHGERTQIYVNRGTGYWGPPMRLGSPAEITRLELVRRR